MGRMEVKGAMGTHKVETWGLCYYCRGTIVTKSEDEELWNDLARGICVCPECQKLECFKDGSTPCLKGVPKEKVSRIMKARTL